MKRFIFSGIRIAVTVGLFLLLFRPETFGLRPDQFGGVKPGDMLRELSEAGAQNVAFWLILAFIVKMLGMLAGVMRWRILLHGQGLQIPLKFLLQSWFIGRFIGIFLPGTIGLDGYRLYDSSRYTGDVIRCTTVIAVEKLIGFIALTLLVFLTFPLGFHLLQLRIPVLAVILLVLAAAVIFFFTLLLNPRIIQVLVSVFPTPAQIRRPLLRIGAAVTAYSGAKRDLLLAVMYGFFVHFNTCLMYFGTMMAIRAENTSFWDILFASPLMIYGTVLGPSIGGEGIREIVFVTLLGGKSSTASALTFAHLGWWVGEVIPFLIGAVVYLTRAPLTREALAQELREKQTKEVHAADLVVPLTPEQTAHYRSRVSATLGIGLAAGLIVGALLGILESGWVSFVLPGLTDTQMFVWGAAVYSVIFAGLGLGLAAVLLFLWLAVDRFPGAFLQYALTTGGLIFTVGVVIGAFRYQRDVLHGHTWTAAALLVVVVAAVAAWCLLLFFSRLLLRRTRAATAGVRGVSALVVLSWLVLFGLAAIAGAVFKPSKTSSGTTPEPGATAPAQAPNIVLIGIDTLRADYLRIYRNTAVAKTPHLDAFARDAVVFEHAFSQASWTKPSFATIFTGLYPCAHTATTKTAALPEEVVTLAERLNEGGYYTAGFANNPNISPTFRFGQGFVEYTELRPRLYFWASASSAKLSLYEILRRARQMVLQKAGRVIRSLGKMHVEDFYQPAEAVTQTALEWTARNGKEHTPFYLFLHYMDPHDPFFDEEAPEGAYARVRMENPDPSLAEPMRRAYVKEIEYLDTHLGRLFEGLKAQGLYDGSLIIVTADHGEEFHEHGGWWHGQTLYDEVTHVPLLIKFPAQQHSGIRNSDLARHLDLAPTLLAWAGLPVPTDLRGVVLCTPEGQFGNTGVAAAYAENDFEGNILHAVRTKQEKIIEANTDNTRNLAPLEIYDLDQDPGEKSNLANESSWEARRNHLRTMLDEFKRAACENAVEPAAPTPIPSVDEERMRALGYN